MIFYKKLKTGLSINNIIQGGLNGSQSESLIPVKKGQLAFANFAQTAVRPGKVS